MSFALKTLFQALLTLVVLYFSTAQAQVILQHPENYTVYENQRVQFVCYTDDEAGVFWRINGRNPLAFDLLDVLQTTLGPTGNHGELLLTFIAVSEYNKSLVQCHSFDGISSEVVTFKIQGVLADVSSFEVNYDRRSVTVSWTAPFSLNVTGVEPDIWYSVIIHNVTDENNPIVINITDTQYTFTPKSCNVYNVSVVSFNGAGQGNISDEVTIQATELQKGSITATDDGSRDITLTILCEFQTVSNISFNHNEVVYEADVTDEVMIINLPANIIFDSGVFEILLTDDEKMEYELPEALSTYDIQRPQIESVDDDKIIVTGELINGSTAIGCFLVIESTNNEISFIALKLSIEGGQNFSEVIQLPSSNYSVYIHDLEENGLPNIHPAHLQPFFITLHGNYNQSRMYENPTCASFFRNCSHLAVMCEATGQSNDTSCIIVYRAHGNPMLNFIQNKAVSLDFSSETVNYTVAVFKSFHHSIEERPCASTVVTHTHCKISSRELNNMMQTPSLSSFPTVIPESEGNIHVVVFVYSGAAAFIVALSVAIVLLIMLVIIRKKSGNKAATRAVECDKEAEYEEIDLPVATTSSVIDTLPNTAYVTTTLSHPSTAINTTDNVAYGRI